MKPNMRQVGSPGQRPGYTEEREREREREVLADEQKAVYECEPGINQKRGGQGAYLATLYLALIRG
jgi:hypothetical protein